MYKRVFGLSAFLLIFSAALSAAEVQGTVIDPSGAPVGGAMVSLVGRLGLETQAATAPNGTFRLPAPEAPETRLVVTAPGFATRSLRPEEAGAIRLEIAPVVDSVRVAGTAIDAPAAEQGGSVSLIPGAEVRSRNEPMAADLLRYIPGFSLAQTGATGGVSAVFTRGGNSNFNLVEIDGVPVNKFGGDFDFAHIPTEMVERVEVARGPQSAIYGPYATSGVVNFVTRQPDAVPRFDVLAEGGTYRERRVGLSATGVLAGFGLAASASQMNSDGPVANSDYRNQGLTLGANRRLGRHALAFHGYFDSDENGVPGPWGSDPVHTFTGIDTVSRNRNNFSAYAAHWEADLSGRVRQEAFGTFFLNNNGFVSPYGFSFNKDLRGQAETRTVVSVSRHYVTALGASESLEEVKNSYIYDAAYDTFPVRRNDTAIYLENRFEFGGRLFINAGVRGEWFRTGAIPAGDSRPLFPAQVIGSANPKIAVSYNLGATRLHAAFGTGIRPPNGFDLAYTDNPALKPERTRSFEAGIDRKLWRDRVALGGTYFYNRFYDLIVILGGSLARLSRYSTDNLANSRAQGVELTLGIRPFRTVFVNGSYTRLNTQILSVDGTAAAAPAPFHAGQELVRRPGNSGSLVAGYTRGKVTAAVTGLFRGPVLDVEPSYGAAFGLFRNPGYANVGLNLNYTLSHGFTVYGHLRNALNRHYEEVFGYPSPRLNFVTGVKWGFGKQ